jgi:hypothetical protein
LENDKNMSKNLKKTLTDSISKELEFDKNKKNKK